MAHIYRRTILYYTEIPNQFGLESKHQFWLSAYMTAVCSYLKDRIRKPVHIVFLTAFPKSPKLHSNISKDRRKDLFGLTTLVSCITLFWCIKHSPNNKNTTWYDSNRQTSDGRGEVYNIWWINLVDCHCSVFRTHFILFEWAITRWSYLFGPYIIKKRQQRTFIQSN